MRNTIENKTLIVTITLVVCMVASLVFALAAQAQPVWSKAKTRRVVEQACNYYDLSTAETNMLKRYAVDIIYTGAHESSGGLYTGGACKGILQYDSGWHLGKRLAKRYKKIGHHHHKGNWRYCGSCSIYRYVRCYKIGGESKLWQHWAATLGR